MDSYLERAGGSLSERQSLDLSEKRATLSGRTVFRTLLGAAEGGPSMTEPLAKVTTEEERAPGAPTKASDVSGLRELGYFFTEDQFPHINYSQ